MLPRTRIHPGKAFDMSAHVEVADKKSVITLDGDLTLGHAGEIKRALEQALNGSDAVLVKFGSVKSVDLAALQLLCSAHRTATGRQKTLTCVGSPPDGYWKFMDEAGYARTTGCSLDSTNTCIWVKRNFIPE